MTEQALPATGIPGRLAALRDEGAEELTFTGGEPGLVPWLADAVRAARAAGFARVGVQSNGRRLAGPGLLESLAEAGLTDIHLSIHGAEAAVHDYHTGMPGSFAATFATLGRARAMGLVVAVTTVLTRSNVRALAGLPWLLRARGAAAWHLTMALDAGRAAAAFDRVVPRLGLAMPYALHALDAAAKVGLPSFVSGAPLCLLGPYAHRVLPEPPRSFGAACGTCEARPDCAGVERRYLQRFGGDELTASPRPSRVERDAVLARLFVGVGEAAPPPDIDLPGSPAAARAALPGLGRPVPATKEVARTAERRSGEALREIFPLLFDGPAGGALPSYPVRAPEGND